MVKTIAKITGLTLIAFVAMLLWLAFRVVQAVGTIGANGTLAIATKSASAAGIKIDLNRKPEPKTANQTGG